MNFARRLLPCFLLLGWLTSCAPTYPTKAYGRAFMIEAYKQGYYAKPLYEYEMDRISRMNVPEGTAVDKTLIRRHVQSIFGNVSPMQQTPSGSYSENSQFEYVYHQPSSGPYTYTPQPQPQYVYGPAHNPGGGYTPQPQQRYVQNSHHQPGGSEFKPAPMQEYKYYDRPASSQPEYRPTPAPEYVYHKQPQQTEAAYKPETPPTYVNHQPKTSNTDQSIPVTTQPDKYLYRKDMTPAQQKAFDASNTQKQYAIVNPHDHLAANVTREEQQNIDRFGVTGNKVLKEVQKDVVATVVTRGVLSTAPSTGLGARVMNQLRKMLKREVKEHIETHSESSEKKQ